MHKCPMYKKMFFTDPSYNVEIFAIISYTFFFLLDGKQILSLEININAYT